MAVLVRYDSGASMSYHLTAYSPWEGYRVAFNGTGGRLELDVAENTWRAADAAAASPSGALHGEDPAPDAGGATITVRPLWQPPRQIAIPVAKRRSRRRRRAADRRPVRCEEPAPEAADAIASERDGAYALAVGAAANRSFGTGLPGRRSRPVHGLIRRPARSGQSRSGLVSTPASLRCAGVIGAGAPVSGS